MINIKTDTKKLEYYLRGKKTEIPFATAMALTKTAKDVQSDMIEHTKQRYTIRKPWLEKGKYSIRTTPAKKNNLTAKVWNDAPFMMLHEKGGDKMPKGKYIAIPTADVKRNKKDIIPEAQRPRTLIDKGAYKAITKKGTALLLMKKGKKIVKYLYSLIEKATIKPTWEFEKTARKSAEKHWAKNMMEALRQVLSK